ncbi:NADP-binding protein [Gigaspora margarita]|uniref:NADP-binding protein n=1 Tax=Gigaspora margarita TaxID=4874 RepID=A0A8H3X8N4_GIGMA|nr:NADP-binding protein [Gigaspora margarita]
MSKVVIVTGASRGIGRATTLQLLQHFNSNVIAVARSNQDLCDLKNHAENVLGMKGRLETVTGDITEEHIIEEVVKKCLEQWGRIDGIIANAGVLDPMGNFADINLQEWKRHFDVNFFSNISLIQKSIPYLRTSKGRIITISTGVAAFAHQSWSPYCTSKAALHMLTKCIAVEEPDIVSVSILPGVVDTTMQANIREQGLKAQMKQTDYQRYIDLYESKTLVHPDEPGRVLAALVVGGATQEMSGESYRYNDPKLAHLLDKK